MEAHLKAFSSNKYVILNGIYNRTKIKAQKLGKKYNISNVCNNTKELYQKTKPDGLVICVSIQSTKKVCKEAFKYFKNILIEKPIGHNLREAKYLYNLSKKYKCNVFIALNRRQYRSTISAKKNLRDNYDKKIIEVVDSQDQFLDKNKI